MSTGSPAPSVAPSSSIAPSAGTLKSTPTRKKRTIVVVRRPRDRGLPDSGDDDDGASRGAPPLKKKTLLVARRPRASEGRLFEDETAPPGEGSDAATGGEKDGGSKRGGQRNSDNRHLSSTVATKLEWLPDGHVLDKSVLGTAAAFEEV